MLHTMFEVQSIHLQAALWMGMSLSQIKKIPSFWEWPPPSPRNNWGPRCTFFPFFIVFVKDSILGNWLQKRTPEARGKSSAKRERERRRRESPPEAKGERSEPFAGGARDSAKRNRVFVIMAKFLSPSSHVTCQNWIRPFTKKHRFIAQIDSARSNIASTAWRPCGLSPGIGYRVPENVL